jgi:hypothetical protein
VATIYAAHALGLSSTPMIGFDAEAVAREFALAEDEVPVMLLSVGAALPKNWPQKPRRPVADVLEFAGPRNDSIPSRTFPPLRRLARSSVNGRPPSGRRSRRCNAIPAAVGRLLSSCPETPENPAGRLMVTYDDPSAISLARPKGISSPWAIVITMRPSVQAAARQRVDREAHDVGF